MPITQEQQTEIEAARAESHPTRRPTVPALEEILGQAFPLLDHGFVRVVDYMGDDGAIVQAARISYGRGTRKVSEDAALIAYLMRHHHTTPFEMCEIKYHMKLPIFVARQLVRHRTANINEYSARYSILDNEFYIPKAEDLGAQSSVNRQGRGDTVSSDEAAAILELLREDATGAYRNYQYLLNDDGAGNPADPERSMLARELARMGLSLNFYTQWYWKIDLNNLFKTLYLRADEHAQYEIRVYADVMLDTVKRWVPMAHAAFVEHWQNATNLSAAATSVIMRLLSGEKIDQKTSGLGRREWNEVMPKFGLPQA